MLEIEAKFHVANLQQVEKRLVDLGAGIIQSRHFEHNDRYDTPDRRLSASGQVLRLREADRQTLTYKEPSGQKMDGLIRKELEVEIGDIKLAGELLQALGFVHFQSYEKYRTTYSFRETCVMLDELPFGDWIEIEGPDIETIQNVTASLNLTWGKRIKKGYLVLFNDLCKLIKNPPKDLTFTSPRIKFPSLEAIGIHPADQN